MKHPNKGKPSSNVTADIRLIVAIVTSLLDEAAIVALIIWLLPKVGVQLPWWGLAILVAGFAAFAIFTYKVGSRALKARPMAGFTSMVGMEGRVAAALNPEGLVKIDGELWSARAEKGYLEAGETIIVITQRDLLLIVRAQRRSF
jgi:membrane-bound ClpP family serine protease